MEITKETIEKTTKCLKNFECLNGGSIRCKVEDCINNEVHFVKSSSTEYCPYNLSFGDDNICTCPTRKEIYNKYGI